VLAPHDFELAAVAMQRRLDTERDAMVDLLAALVAVPTENPPGRACLPCVEFLHAAAVDLGLDCRRIDIPSHAGC
jgi:acetylornithine deacetylase/succinyl-diaminopimelate desuccinylase-like protein